MLIAKCSNIKMMIRIAIALCWRCFAEWHLNFPNSFKSIRVARCRLDSRNDIAMNMHITIQWHWFACNNEMNARESEQTNFTICPAVAVSGTIRNTMYLRLKIEKFHVKA